MIDNPRFLEACKLVLQRKRTLKEVAEEFGCSVSTVWKWVEELRVGILRKKRLPAEKAPDVIKMLLLDMLAKWEIIRDTNQIDAMVKLAKGIREMLRFSQEMKALKSLPSYDPIFDLIKLPLCDGCRHLIAEFLEKRTGEKIEAK